MNEDELKELVEKFEDEKLSGFELDKPMKAYNNGLQRAKYILRSYKRKAEAGK